MRVLYFTVVPLGDEGNGGGLCCRNHVRRLHEDPDIDLVVLAAGDDPVGDGTSGFLASLAIPHDVVRFQQQAVPLRGETWRDRIALYASTTFPFPWEVRALNQPQVQERLDEMIRAHQIEYLVIDYLPSALFIDVGRRDVRTALITLNREGDFYRDQIGLGHIGLAPFVARISLKRLRAAERRLHRAVGKVVAIGPPDIPNWATRSAPAYITPYFNSRPDGWRYSATRRCFFVGNVGHYPNRLAVDWLVGQLAPHLAALAPDIRLTIVGAAPEHVAPTGLPPNVECLGPANAETVAELFRTADLMLCPVENNFGVKFKAVECLSYNTPLLASRQTRLGLPHIKDLPAIDLARPRDAAETIHDLLSQPERLLALQASQQAQQDAFIASQHGIWSRTLLNIPA